jgi:hypothetical protein
MWNWSEYQLLPCMFKTFTGWDCPGCGFQRSLLFLFKGDIQNSFSLYPATIPILLLVLWSIIGMRCAIKSSALITRSLVFLSAATIIISYALKLASAGI